MPYSFIYDLTKISQGVFNQLFDLTFNLGVHKFVGLNAKKLVKLFKIDQATGLNFTDAITLVEDLIDIQVANRNQRKKFEKANRKVILLPHCLEPTWIVDVWLNLFQVFQLTNVINVPMIA